ncbi:MAG: hypothetical protein GY913_28775, partial [Proteobacteria bacterium]|nr:hypothetical protein [Pseudomonadota bacterium]
MGRLLCALGLAAGLLPATAVAGGSVVPDEPTGETGEPTEDDEQKTEDEATTAKRDLEAAEAHRALVRARTVQHQLDLL